MYKTKIFTKRATVYDANGDKHIIFVYGELTRTNILEGVLTQKVRYVNGDKRIVEEISKPEIINCQSTACTTKTFNFGWAICDPKDEFDEKKGIEICKKRFGRAPITTQEGRFLTNDMIEAILANEVEFVKREKLIPIIGGKKLHATYATELKNKSFSNENDYVKKYVDKKIEEKAKFSDGDILRIVTKNGNVCYGAYHSIDQKENTVTLYWGVSSTNYSSCISAPYTIKVNNIVSVEKACREDILEKEKLLETKFNKVWNWKKKRLEVKNPNEKRSILDFFC